VKNTGDFGFQLQAILVKNIGFWLKLVILKNIALALAFDSQKT